MYIYYLRMRDKKIIERVHFISSLFCSTNDSIFTDIRDMTTKRVNYTYSIIHVKSLILQIVNTYNHVFKKQGCILDVTMDIPNSAGITISKMEFRQFLCSILHDALRKKKDVKWYIYIEDSCVVIDFNEQKHGIIKYQSNIKEKNSHKNTKVLLVDDDNVCRKMIKAAFKKEYPSVYIDEANNGYQALNKCACDTFDIIMCDVCMPGMDGPKFVNLSKFNDKTCVVFISSEDNDEIVNLILKTSNTYSQIVNKVIMMHNQLKYEDNSTNGGSSYLSDNIKGHQVSNLINILERLKNNIKINPHDTVLMLQNIAITLGSQSLKKQCKSYLSGEHEDIDDIEKCLDDVTQRVCYEEYKHEGSSFEN